MIISEWKSFCTDEQVDSFISQFLNRSILKESPFDSIETVELYDKVIHNKDINNRSKLFYLEQFENLIIKGRISTVEGIIKYKDSLF